MQISQYQTEFFPPFSQGSEKKHFFFRKDFSSFLLSAFKNSLFVSLRPLNPGVQKSGVAFMWIKELQSWLFDAEIDPKGRFCRGERLTFWVLSRSLTPTSELGWVRKNQIVKTQSAPAIFGPLTSTESGTQLDLKASSLLIRHTQKSNFLDFHIFLTHPTHLPLFFSAEYLTSDVTSLWGVARTKGQQNQWSHTRDRPQSKVKVRCITPKMNKPTEAFTFQKVISQKKIEKKNNKRNLNNQGCYQCCQNPIMKPAGIFSHACWKLFEPLAILTEMILQPKKSLTIWLKVSLLNLNLTRNELDWRLFFQAPSWQPCLPSRFKKCRLLWSKDLSFFMKWNRAPSKKRQLQKIRCRLDFFRERVFVVTQFFQLFCRNEKQTCWAVADILWSTVVLGDLVWERNKRVSGGLSQSLGNNGSQRKIKTHLQYVNFLNA